MGTESSLATLGIGPKPTQLDPTPSAQAARSIDWAARLPSDTAKGEERSTATTIASAACATYGPERRIDPSLRRVSRSCTTMKCQG